MLVIVKRKQTGPAATQVSDRTADLLKSRGTMVDGRVDWCDWNESKPTVASLTNEEIQALKRKHGTPLINQTRAGMVKAAMIEGRSIAEMERMFAPLGRGYGERMIAADHATLSKFIKKR